MNKGVYLFCEWVENGKYKCGYKFFTAEEFEQMKKDTIVYPKLGIRDKIDEENNEE